MYMHQPHGPCLWKFNQQNYFTNTLQWCISESFTRENFPSYGTCIDCWFRLIGWCQHMETKYTTNNDNVDCDYDLDEWWDARRVAECLSICWWSLLMSSLSRRRKKKIEMERSRKEEREGKKEGERWGETGRKMERSGRRKGRKRRKKSKPLNHARYAMCVQLTWERGGKIEDPWLSC